MDLEQERNELVRANRDIAEGERRITEQQDLLTRMHNAGHDTRQGERLLTTLQATLLEWQAHRELILQAIARLEAPPA
jgi:hypothetical protein